MNFKELRQKLGLTQKAFGLLLGFKNPQIRISELENGKQKGSNQLIRYCHFLEYLVKQNQKDLIINFYNLLNIFQIKVDHSPLDKN